MTAEMLRPKEAAARFKVARTTLVDWADAGLIGRSRVGKAVWYVADDIADVIARGLTPRTVVPISATPATQDDSWRDSDLWAGTSVGRQG
jgi:hypothetical protein